MANEEQQHQESTTVNESLPQLVEAILPSVVNIAVTTAPDSVVGGMPDPLWRFKAKPFSSGAHIINNRVQTIGSGFFVHEEGLVVTNNHIVDGAQSIKVSLNDGRELDAKLIGQDNVLDLAVIKVQSPSKFPVLQFGDSDKLQVGEDVFAVGNPLGFGGTVTKGIVSAKARSLKRNPYEEFIQTDASANGGSSGGPLMNRSGQVIGIITAGQRVNLNSGDIGINFAIPSNSAQEVIKVLSAGETPKRPLLGITAKEVDEDIADAVGLSKKTGVLVTSVVPGSASEKGGLKQGDVILYLNGRKISSYKAMGEIARSTLAVGESASLVVWRFGESIKINTHKLPTRAKEGGTKEAIAGNKQVAKETSYRGFVAIEVTPELAEKINLKQGIKGVLVNNITSKFIEDRAEIFPGDIILKCNGNSITNTKELDLFLLNLQKSGKKTALVDMISLRREGGKDLVSVRFFE